jgi:hypothetical protein
MERQNASLKGDVGLCVYIVCDMPNITDVLTFSDSCIKANI